MKKKILYNVGSSLILEIVSVICAFILPRMIISGFGSEYNGVVASVTQFLSVVTLLRGGVGGVMRAALYRPLVENDIQKISAIVNETERFMRRIAYIFVGFLLVFAAGYPLLVEEFDWLYTFSLVLVLGISTIAQYYFGITNQFLLSADQKSYIYSITQTVATILNTVFSVVLINMGVEFRLMKLISALIFAAIPIVLYWYVHKKYTILKDVPRDRTCITQRWDAFVHQVAAFVHTNTDLALLTIFSDLYQVSVYSVYNMVITGVKKFVTVFTSGIESTIGKIIAKNDAKQLEVFTDAYEWSMNIIATTMFGCAAALIVPFMKVYMMDVEDANYIQPALAYLLVAASFLACIRLPYQSIVESAGHFKQTRNGAIAEVSINLGLSLLLIGPFGAVGVAIGTVVAMGIRTVQYALYSAKYILKRSHLHFVKRVAVTTINILAIFVPFFCFKLDMLLMRRTSDFIVWVMEAVAVFAGILLITLLVNMLAYQKTARNMIRTVVKRKQKSSHIQ